jgi:hypothetical protein
MDRALIVGISDYGRLNQPLPGCINDMNDWREVLVGSQGFDGDHVRLLADDRATKPEIETRLDWLLADAEDGDRRVFIFAGHGLRLRHRERDTGDLDDRQDEALVTYPPAEGDLDSYLIYDDDLAELVDKSRAAQSSCHFTFILDSCHSGGMLRKILAMKSDVPLPRCWEPPPDIAARAATTAVLPLRRFGSLENAKAKIPRLVIAAARQEESAWDATMDDGRRHGAFTYHATRALRRNSDLSADALIGQVLPVVAARFPQHPGLLGEESRFNRPVFEAASKHSTANRRSIKMATFENFECTFHMPSCDVTDLNGTRRQLKQLIDDDAFAKMISDLNVAAKHAGAGPAPRASTEFEVGCNTDFKGDTSCEGKLRIRF